MQGIVYKFESFAALTQALDTEEPDVKLPVEDGLVDGQWLVATFAIGNDATSIAGRVADRGSELHLTFEERDWNQLCRFANGQCSPSIPPRPQKIRKASCNVKMPLASRFSRTAFNEASLFSFSSQLSRTAPWAGSARRPHT